MRLVHLKCKIQKNWCTVHCGTNKRASRWTFTDPCKPEVRPGVQDESASPAWLAAPAMNARDTTKVYIWRLDTGCGLTLYRKCHSHKTPGERHNNTWVEPLAGNCTTSSTRQREQVWQQCKIQKNWCTVHCGTNKRAPRWTFTNPCKPEVRPGARDESASPAWLAAPAMNTRDTTKVYIWRLDTGCELTLYRKCHSHNTQGKMHYNTWVEPLAGNCTTTSTRQREQVWQKCKIQKNWCTVTKSFKLVYVWYITLQNPLEEYNQKKAASPWRYWKLNLIFRCDCLSRMFW